MINMILWKNLTGAASSIWCPIDMLVPEKISIPAMETESLR